MLRLYINGSQIGAEFPVTSINTQPIGQIRVGFTEFPGTNYFPGRIDDIRIYNHALTSNEIRTLASPIESGVIARYDFRGDTLDVSGFGNLLTGNNLTTISNRWKEPGSAYRFNGTNSRAFQTNLPATNVDDYSFSAWIRPNIVPTANFVIFVNGNTSSNGYGLFLASVTGRLAYIQGAVSTNVTTVAIPPRVWTHVGLVKQLGTIRLYANGREIFNLPISNPNVPLTAFSIGSNESNLEHWMQRILHFSQLRLLILAYRLREIDIF